MKRIFLLSIVPFLLFSACRNHSDPQESVPVKITNEYFDLVIENLPPEWTVIENREDMLRFSPAQDDLGGSVEVFFAPEDLGVNLIEAMHAHKEEILARPGGEYKGGREMTGPLGTAFYSRGRFNDSGVPSEEITIFFLHPRKERIVGLRYDYPVNEHSQGRIEALFSLFGGISINTGNLRETDVFRVFSAVGNTGLIPGDPEDLRGFALDFRCRFFLLSGI